MCFAGSLRKTDGIANHELETGLRPHLRPIKLSPTESLLHTAAMATAGENTWLEREPAKAPLEQQQEPKRVFPGWPSEPLGTARDQIRNSWPW